MKWHLLLMTTSSCLSTKYCAAQVPQRAGEQELTRVAFKGGKGTYQLADGTVHTGRLQLKTSSSVTIQAPGQLDGVEFKPSELRQFTIGTDSFVVVRDFWVPRYKGSGFSRKFDPLDTAHVSIAFVQKHINRGGLELLRYVDVRAYDGYLMGANGSPGSTYAANDFYGYYLFRRRSAAPATYRAVPGEAASIRKFFGPLIADVPTVHDYLLTTTFTDLKLPRIFGLYLYSKGY